MFVSKKKSTLAVVGLVFLLSVIVPAQGNPYVIVDIIAKVLAVIVNVARRNEKASVIVENHGRHHAHLWCASRDDRIGGQDGVWVAPGAALGWAFRKNIWGTTQFWCTMDWYGRRYHWDVFVANWGGNRGHWKIRDDGIYEGGGAKRMYIESNIPV